MTVGFCVDRNVSTFAFLSTSWSLLLAFSKVQDQIVLLNQLVIWGNGYLLKQGPVTLSPSTRMGGVLTANYLTELSSPRSLESPLTES